MNSIRVLDLSVEYRVVKAFSHVSFSIDGKKVLGILGPNGAGKTTLLKAIAGIVKYSGSVFIDGKELSRIPMKTIAKLLSYASDINPPEFMPLTVVEALLMSRYPVSRGFFDKARDKRFVEQVMEELGIAHLRNRRLNELSSGELRKVVIAMALAKNPRYILLDEPDSHMDLRSKVLISKIIRKLARKHVVVFTSHDILFALNTADYLILLKDGVIVKQGYVEEVVSTDVLEKLYGIKFRQIIVDGKKLFIPVYS